MSKAISGQTLVQAFEQWVPKRLAIQDDKIGLQIGTLDKPIHRIMVTLDVLENVVDEAIEKDIDFIFAHHAVIFRPLKNMRTDRGQSKIVAKCIKNDITVYVAHTNLDQADGGMNDWLADAIDLQDRAVMIPMNSGEGERYGLGRVGRLTEPMTLKALAEKVKNTFGLDGVRVVGNLDQKVKKVAVLGGDGNRFITQAKFSGADVLITGDIYYHTAHDAILEGLSIIDAGHHIEKVMKQGVSVFFKRFLKEKGYDGTTVYLSEANTNPFQFI
ncbi:Nif3-like dinuclear metal center hexameric protein [Camelliibacillus cellulosilyticus]|uniref:GTP cyclohydrolase 1 type 2 homolog n=1 Tax=Camelliibacillus cellulosilyticus TaxID=2174486 RepID=A0ABV9GMA8_9BACL